MFSIGDIDSFVGGDVDIFFEGDSAEDVDLDGDVIFDEAFDSISDGDDVALLDEVGCVSFEEGLGGAGLICDDAVNHGYFESFFGFDEFVIC